MSSTIIANFKEIITDEKGIQIECDKVKQVAIKE